MQRRPIVVSGSRGVPHPPDIPMAGGQLSSFDVANGPARLHRIHSRRQDPSVGCCAAGAWFTGHQYPAIREVAQRNGLRMQRHRIYIQHLPHIAQLCYSFPQHAMSYHAGGNLEHFPIIQALCRSALAEPNDAVRRQVERLRDALTETGASKEAAALAQLLATASRSSSMAPSRLIRSRASYGDGEALTAQSAAPVDRETAVPLATLTFPDEIPEPLLHGFPGLHCGPGLRIQRPGNRAPHHRGL